MIFFKIKASYFLFTINAQSIYYFLLYFFIPLIVLFVGLIIFSLLYGRYAGDKNEHKQENIENDTNNFLTDLIFSDYNAVEMRVKINEFKLQYKLNTNLRKYILCQNDWQAFARPQIYL